MKAEERQLIGQTVVERGVGSRRLSSKRRGWGMSRRRGGRLKGPGPDVHREWAIEGVNPIAALVSLRANPDKSGLGCLPAICRLTATNSRCIPHGTGPEAGE
jgi:hypothetical protein